MPENKDENYIWNKREFKEAEDWVNFWDLLLKIDRRNHPEYYKKEDKND